MAWQRQRQHVLTSHLNSGFCFEERLKCTLDKLEPTAQKLPESHLGVVVAS